MGTTKRSVSSLANRSATTLSAFDAPSATRSTEQHMGSIGMFFDPQRQLIIHILEMRVFDDDRFKCLQSCSCIWGQLCHISDTPLRLEGSSDQVHRPFPDRCRSLRDGLCSTDQQ